MEVGPTVAVALAPTVHTAQTTRSHQYYYAGALLITF